MSPEQAKSSKHVDERTDVWSLGVTLYQLLTGNATPFATRPSFAELVLVICTQEPRHVQDAAPWIDPALAVVLHGALIRDRDARYPSVAAFADALERHAAGGIDLEPAHLVGIDVSMRDHVAARAELPTRAMLRAADDEIDPLVGKSVGRYRLERRLGRGGMGAVYEATAPDGRRVALKVILEGDARASPDARRRFVREARSTASVRGAHVVEILDADVDEATGTPFLAMELLKGTDLDHWIAQLGPLPPEIAARVFLQACRGLVAAHAKGIVHRDIKPANLFLAEDAQGGVTVKVCDFGIAKSTATDGLDPTTAALTKTGGMLGSPIYMSPEQARNAKQVDARSDVWSLCISMHEALAGARPWSHCTTIGELILGICTEDVRPLRGLAPWIDDALAEVVHHGLARASEQRWQDVASLERALAPFAGDGKLTREMLQPLPPHLRAQIDPHAATVAISSRTTAATARATSAATTAEPKRRRTALWSAVAVIAVALAGGVAYSQLRDRTGAVKTAATDTAIAVASESTSAAADPIVSASVASSPSSTSAPRETARVTVVPADAKVTVDGAATDVADGVLTLTGEPGAELHVVVSAYGKSVDQVVVLAKGGLAHPDKIMVPKSGAGLVATVKTPIAKPTASTTATTPVTATAAPSLTIKEGL
jgi:serine/threonine-protein kinase